MFIESLKGLADTFKTVVPSLNDGSGDCLNVDSMRAEIFVLVVEVTPST